VCKYIPDLYSGRIGGAAPHDAGNGWRRLVRHGADTGDADSLAIGACECDAEQYRVLVERSDNPEVALLRENFQRAGREYGPHECGGEAR
jgi:hypothetical protein